MKLQKNEKGKKYRFKKMFIFKKLPNEIKKIDISKDQITVNYHSGTTDIYENTPKHTKNICDQITTTWEEFSHHFRHKDYGPQICICGFITLGTIISGLGITEYIVKTGELPQEALVLTGTLAVGNFIYLSNIFKKTLMFRKLNFILKYRNTLDDYEKIIQEEEKINPIKTQKKASLHAIFDVSKLSENDYEERVNKVRRYKKIRQ